MATIWDVQTSKQYCLPLHRWQTEPLTSTIQKQQQTVSDLDSIHAYSTISCLYQWLFLFFLTAHTTNGAELLIVNRGCYILKVFWILSTFLLLLLQIDVLYKKIYSWKKSEIPYCRLTDQSNLMCLINLFKKDAKCHFNVLFAYGFFLF